MNVASLLFSVVLNYASLTSNSIDADSNPKVPHPPAPNFRPKPSSYNRRVETADVVIAGAGIIGLSLALDLASHGLRVTVLERGRAMSEASWAAAGMLAANDPDILPQLRELAQFSLSLYPEYLQTIESLSGKRIPIRTQAAIHAVHRGEFFTEPTLSPAELRQLVPQLNTADRQFVLLQEQSLDPRDLCSALPLASKAAGIDLRENSPAISIDTGPRQTIVVQTPTEPIAATHFVNCAGAWADFPALAIAPNRPLGVFPRKGQITTVRLRTPDTLNHVLRTPEIYIVPRGDGRLTIGATVEHSGYDKTVEPAAIARLLAAAVELWPPIAHAEIIESWAGLRPATASELPLIGPLLNPSSHPPNRWVATGHFRNGILLAPATARVLSQAIRGQAPEGESTGIGESIGIIDLAPFDPCRLHQQNPAEHPVLSPV
jgi:glycine oxidase